MKMMGYIMLVIVLSMFALPVMAASSVRTVTRSFSGTTIAPDATVTITITPTNLPSGPFYTYETIPAGFTFVSTTAYGYSNVGNVYTLKQIGSTAFTYTIKAPAETGTYTFTGMLKDIDLGTGPVGGANQIIDGAVRTTPTSTVTRSFSRTTVAPDATVTITITPANLPSGAFYTYENIPAVFTFVSTTAFGSSNVGNTYTLEQSRSTAFTYTIKAPAETGTYIFTGTFKDIDLGAGPVGGANQITVVEVPTPTYGVTKRSDYLSMLNQFFKSIFISTSRFFHKLF